MIRGRRIVVKHLVDVIRSSFFLAFSLAAGSVCFLSARFDFAIILDARRAFLSSSRFDLRIAGDMLRVGDCRLKTSQRGWKVCCYQSSV